MKIKRAASSVIILIILLLTPGCYDYREPDDIAWVMAVGLDRGRQNKLTMTAVLAVPKAVTGGGGGGIAAGGGGGANKFQAVSMEVPTLLSGLELLNSIEDRRADLSHTKWIVFSRELAEQDISPYLSPLSRFRQFRRTTHIVVSQVRAEDFLRKGVPTMEDNVGKYYGLLWRGWRYTGFIPYDTFHQFYVKATSPGMAPVALLASTERTAPVYPDNSPKPKGDYEAGRLPRKGGGGIEIMGTAVFNGGRMIGTLNGDETEIGKMLGGTFKRSILSVPDPLHPDKYIVVEIKQRQPPKVAVRIGEDGMPDINVEVYLEGDVQSIQSGEEYETPDRIPMVEWAVKKTLQKNMKETVDKSLEWGVDFLSFGQHAKKLFLTWQEWENYRWNEKYSQARVTANIDYRVRRIGFLHETVPLRTYPR